MGADGSDIRRVSQTGANSGYAFSMPLWSPDGTRIVTYTGQGNSPGHDIWVFRADGGGGVQVATEGDDYWATWSPDGQRIAYDNQLIDVRLAFVDAEGSTPLVLDEPEIDRWEPVWSPDGTRVVVHLGPDLAGNDLGIVDPEGEAEMVRIPATRPGGVSWQRLEPAS
jgi:Tol biopolymer transport system component